MSVPEVMATSAHRRSLKVLSASSLLGYVNPVPAMFDVTPENPIIVSASELRDFLRCRQRWWWRHQCRLEPTGGAPALAMGGVIHEILEQWYRLPFAKRTPKAMKLVARRRLGSTTPRELDTDDLDLIRAMCEGYAEWAIAQDRRIGLKEANPEEWFDLPLTPDGRIRVRGKIDLPFKSVLSKSTMGFREFKSKAQIKMDSIDMLLQLTVYFWALRSKYPKIKHFEGHFTVLRKQMPTARVRSDLFASEVVERSAEEIDRWVEDTRLIALDMLNPKIYVNPQESCSWDCDFKNPCLLRSTPADLEHVMNTEYRIKERR